MGSPYRKLVVGLTGGIASGKGLVAECFAALGASVIDTDVLAREVLTPGTAGFKAVREAFGDALVSAAGEIDRAALRRRIFADPAARSRLEAIVHPRIAAAVKTQLPAAAGAYVVLVVPLLVERDWRGMVDRVAVVDLPETIQVARLCARDGLSEEDAYRALAAQASRCERRRAADDVIDNSGEPAATRATVAALHRRYLASTAR